jgi:aerobic carbon-monoxide dehydrogenase medium subunit
MKASPFEYVRPKTLGEASAMLAKDGRSTAAIAGGQSLMPMLGLRVAQVDLLVDISRLEALKAVKETAAGLHLGALTRHAAIEDGKVPDPFGGLMRHVARGISYRAIRNHGTIGGSVALADPAADWPPCLMALDATVKISGPKGVRSQAVSDFVQAPYTTSLAAGEIIVGFDIAKVDAPPKWGFAKVVRKSGAFANSIAIVVRRGDTVSVILGAAGPRPVLLPRVGEKLKAGEQDEDALRTAVGADLDARVSDAGAYQRRLHTSTVLRAIRDMRARA